jgi:hypothetical protein
MPFAQRSLASVSGAVGRDTGGRTLNIGDALVEDLLEGLGVLKLLLDLGDDALGKLLLLPRLDLALVADPGVEDGLGLVGNGRLLLELKGLGLKLGGFLDKVSPCRPSGYSSPRPSPVSYLGNGEEVLGDVNDTAEVLDALDALLDGRGVVGTGRVQDAGDLVNLRLRIAGPGRTGVFGDSPEDGQQREGDDGLLVDDVELVADGEGAHTGGGGEDGGLGDGAVAGYRDRVEQRLRLLLGVLGHVGLVAGRGDLGRDARKGAERERWAETGGACCA